MLKRHDMNANRFYVLIMVLGGFAIVARCFLRYGGGCRLLTGFIWLLGTAPRAARGTLGERGHLRGRGGLLGAGRGERGRHDGPHARWVLVWKRATAADLREKKWHGPGGLGAKRGVIA